MPTPLRAVRVSDDLWQRVRRIAHERGESVSEVVREALARYAERHREQS